MTNSSVNARFHLPMRMRRGRGVCHLIDDKLGGQFEGVARKRIFHKQRALDAKVYAITQDDGPPLGSVSTGYVSS